MSENEELIALLGDSKKTLLNLRDELLEIAEKILDLIDPNTDELLEKIIKYEKIK